MHPGGMEITKYAFGSCALPKSAKILDIGCGFGDTAAFLAGEYGYSITGMDISAEVITRARERHPDIVFIEGDGQWLEVESLSFDCVLMECTLSLMSNPVEAIHEAYCTLKKGGYLIIHDLYLPYPSKDDFKKIRQIKKSKLDHTHSSCSDKILSPCTVDGALIMDDIFAAMNELELEKVLFEDMKMKLDSYVASIVFSGNDMSSYSNVRQGKSKISYFLLIARKAG